MDRVKRPKTGPKRKPEKECKIQFGVYIKKEIVDLNNSLKGGYDCTKEDVIDFLFNRVGKEPPARTPKVKVRVPKKSVLKKDPRVPTEKVDVKKSSPVTAPTKISLADALKQA